jgi:hypothetical protein
MVLQDRYCEICGEEYVDKDYAKCKWCKSCQIRDLKNNFTNWTSGNKIIDNFIQEMQLSINTYYEKVLEWIPYDQFKDIREINKGDPGTEYSATWEVGSLFYDDNEMKWTRVPDEYVTLKVLRNSENTINKFLDKV